MLKGRTPRQIDTDLERVVTRFQGVQTTNERAVAAECFAEKEAYLKALQEKRRAMMNRFKETQARNTRTYLK